MKKLAIIIFMAVCANINAITLKSEPTDSLNISINKNTKSVIATNNTNVHGYSLLGDLRELFKSKNMELTDSAWKSIREIVNSDSNKDTSIVFSQNGKQIKIAFNNAGFKTIPNHENNNNTNGNIHRENGNIVITDSPNESVKIGWDGIHVKDGNDEVHISRRGVQVIDGGNEEVNIGFGGGDDSTYNATTINRKSYGSLAGFNVYLGINSLAGTAGTAYNADDYALKPFGSRHFAFGWTKSTNLTNGESARLKLALGLNFSWYNFMLDNNNVWTKGANKIELVPSMVNLKKSKLTISYIDVPLIPYIAFKKGKFIDYIGAGGYVGYRMGSHTKTKTENGSKKDHINNNFYLNDFLYGLTFQVGIHNFPNLFVNYDLNPLFKTNKGPGVNGLSFGIRL
jgi:Outer membrane protein beta-barrel domain